MGDYGWCVHGMGVDVGRCVGIGVWVLLTLNVLKIGSSFGRSLDNLYEERV